MKYVLLSGLVALFSAGCSRHGYEEIISPGGKYRVKTEISGDEAGPTRRLCVILIFKDSGGGENRIQTGASDTMKWALDWHDADTLVFYSSDIGTAAYDIKGRKVSERKPNEEEAAAGREAYKNRYGKFPRI